MRNYGKGLESDDKRYKECGLVRPLADSTLQTNIHAWRTELCDAVCYYGGGSGLAGARPSK
jgi:hypothetical protein